MAPPKPSELSRCLKEAGDFATVIPTPVTTHLMARMGAQCPDERVNKTLSVAAQRFLSTIISDSIQRSKTRQQSSESRGGGGVSKKPVKGGANKTPATEFKGISIDDVCGSLNDAGVSIKKPSYYANQPAKSAAGGPGNVAGVGPGGANRGR